MKISASAGVLVTLLAMPCLAGDPGAAPKADPEAQRRLGFKYYHGEGVKRDHERAVALFEKAADGGDIQSASNLAKMYEFGMGVQQDEGRALAWYVRAAEMGEPLSQFSASAMYYQGRGVAKDRVEAAKWWTIAMAAGGQFAEKIRPGVESAQAKLTPEENAEGERRAAVWLAAHGAKK